MMRRIELERVKSILRYRQALLLLLLRFRSKQKQLAKLLHNAMLTNYDFYSFLQQST